MYQVYSQNCGACVCEVQRVYNFCWARGNHKDSVFIKDLETFGEGRPLRKRDLGLRCSQDEKSSIILSASYFSISVSTCYMLGDKR
jgi:hypothetical protein